jgi:uncharacterized protein (TIGR02996 family)
MDEEFHFLRALFRQPDDALRLVYADWLEERGDLRAEFLRLEVELHRLPKGARKRKAMLEKQLRDLRPRPDAGWVARMSWLRNLPHASRSDLALLSEGKGLIEVRDGQQDTVLLVEGKPIALNWDDCQGSVGQYLVYTGCPCGGEHLRQLLELVAGQVDEARPLADQVEALLALFAPGTYCLHYSPSTVVECVATLEHVSPSSVADELLGYYPAYLRNLVCTQIHESLNEDRVAYYRRQIRAQGRPIVLTTSAGAAWCEFVIDGHHKLEAYNRERVKPAIFGVFRWDAPGISLKEGLSFLPPGHRGVEEYRRMKRQAAR